MSTVFWIIGFLFFCYWSWKFENWYADWAEARRQVRDGEIILADESNDDHFMSATINLAEMKMYENHSSAGSPDMHKEYDIAFIDGKWCLRLLNVYEDMYEGDRKYKAFRIKDTLLQDQAWAEEQRKLVFGSSLVEELLEAAAGFQPFGDPSIQTKIQQAYDLRIGVHSKRKAS